MYLPWLHIFLCYLVLLVLLVLFGLHIFWKIVKQIVGPGHSFAPVACTKASLCYSAWPPCPVKKVQQSLCLRNKWKQVAITFATNYHHKQLHAPHIAQFEDHLFQSFFLRLLSFFVSVDFVAFLALCFLSFLASWLLLAFVVFGFLFFLAFVVSWRYAATGQTTSKH